MDFREKRIYLKRYMLLLKLVKDRSWYFCRSVKEFKFYRFLVLVFNGMG